MGVSTTANHQNKSEKTRLRILDAAAKVFRDKGYAGTTLNDIASASRMRAGSIYYHFDSKEQILQEVLDIGTRRVSEAVVQAIEAMPGGAKPKEKIRVGIEAHLRSLLHHGAYTSVGIRIFGQVPKAVQRRNQRLRDEYGDYWRELLREAREAGEIGPHFNLSLVRMFLFGALNWSVEWFKPGEGPLSELADEIWAILFHGVSEGTGAEASDERSSS